MARWTPFRSAASTGVALAFAGACAPGEKGVVQGRADDPVIVLSEGPCPTTCPVYDMTLRPSGAYTLNAQRFVKAEGVSEGELPAGAWAAAEAALEASGFWTLEPEMTPQTLSTCQPDAPTVMVTWRTAEAKEKTVTYNSGCGVRGMQQLVGQLRQAMDFDTLVWTDDRFDPSGGR